MKNDFFDALNEVYIAGGIGNKLISQFYEDRLNGGIESQFARLAVYMEWNYKITCTKEIKTDHIYELLKFLKEHDFTIPSYSDFTNWEKMKQLSKK